MIGLLHSPINPDRQTIPAHLVGAEIANQEFVKNLLRHLPSRNATFFATEGTVSLAQFEIARFQENDQSHRGTADVWSVEDIPKALASQEFLAFHNAVAPQLHQLSYLRSQFALRPFPITCVAHGFSQQSLLWDIFTRLLITPTLPCDSIICTSRAARQAFYNNLEQVKTGLQEIGLNPPKANIRLDLIPLGVDIEIFRPRDKADARNILGLPRDKTLILHFGRLDHITKADTTPLLLAYRELLDRHGNSLVLVLAGNVSEVEANSIQRTAVKLGCGNQILLRPRPPLIEGPLYYAAADIFVSLSETLQESFGISPLEAMASGLPVVLSDWSGYHETVIPGVTGFHVKTYWAECDREISMFAPLNGWRYDHVRLSQSVAVDIDQLVEHLDTLIGNPQRRATMGEAARRHTLNNYDWAVVIAQYYQLWQELAQIAKHQTQMNRHSQSFLRPSYFQNFGHFATECLLGSEKLDITKRGRQAQHHPQILSPPSEVESVLNTKLLAVILRVVRLATAFKIDTTVRDVCERLGPRHRVHRQEMTYHIMWLIKYGLLKVR